ncbi:hypothetical protein [Alteromonas lipolytica]|uniref:STAS/SEC14 domain-containing protein n=1 Tax=Alteromonas lipolytica TaxID=1856405 RepID=A0A1E8FG86_9ALTE|nr:hypothetical protein [Alteromonas lipolytica]OFI34934.1 hypothetical protein BFC17_15320 [Alteromonas lipolytica]GGF55219.1 hypothetical protein GCM10011338_04320 [Alteromonas lipolytica]
MAKNHYSIICNQQIAIVHINGSWGESTTRRFVREFKKQVSPLTSAPWAQLVYFDNWQFSSPNNEPAISELLQWSVSHNLTHSARIFKTDPLKRYQLNRMMDENDESLAIRHFVAAEEGFSWLAENGFTVTGSADFE